MVLEGALAVADLAQLGARKALGVVVNRFEIGAQLVPAVALEEFDDAGLAGRAGRHLGVQIADDQIGNAHVGGDDVQDRIVGPASAVELQDRQA